MPKNLDRKRWN